MKIFHRHIYKVTEYELRIGEFKMHMGLIGHLSKTKL